MPRMKRKDVLTAIRIAGYHGDKERAIRLYVKNWISLRVYGREFDAGAAMRQNGVPCDCFECRKGKTGAALPGDWPAWKGQQDCEGQTISGP